MGEANTNKSGPSRRRSDWSDVIMLLTIVVGLVLVGLLGTLIIVTNTAFVAYLRVIRYITIRWEDFPSLGANGFGGLLNCAG